MNKPERDYMPSVCRAHQQRARDLGLKLHSKTYARDAEAYMQGVLAALTAVGVMSHDRAQQIAFLTAVGRLPEYMAGQALGVED